MKVLLVGRLPAEEIGGVPAYTALLAETLRARGVDVGVLHPSRARRGSTPAPLAAAPLAPAVGRYARAYAEALGVAVAAPAAIASFRPDLIHLQYGGSMDLLLPKALAGRDAPLLVTAHCGPAWRHLARAPRLAVRRLLPARALVCLGEAQADFFAGAGFPRARIRAVATAIPRPFFTPPPVRIPRAIPRGLYLGRLAPEKGIEAILAALARIPATERPWMDFVGPGSNAFRDRLDRSIRASGLGAWAKILPPVRDAGARVARLDAADFFVHASRADATPLGVLEAMARGLPVAAAALPGTAELLGGAGLLLPPGNDSLLAAALRRLASDARLRERLGRAARLRAERFTPERLADAHALLYAEALERSACGSPT